LLANRLIACFDVKDGRVTKAQQFQDNIDVGDPAELADRLYRDDVDEIVTYDIMASAQKRQIDLEMVRRIAHRTFVPLTVGGGIRSLEDMHLVLRAGAEKISIDSMAVRKPEIITQGSVEFGRQCIVLDPMLATGGSLAHTCQLLLERGATGTIIVVCVLAAPEGIALLKANGLDLAIYTAAVDEHLNEHAFIVPGLGDAGDRQFGSPASSS